MSANPLKSHLFWFLLIGFLIFWVDAHFDHAQEEIIVDKAVLARLSSLWQAQMKREPTPAELDHLVADWIGEEMFYREAKQLGLDQDDFVIRRRLVQKIKFIAEEPAAQEPDETSLQQYFLANAKDYTLPDRFSFTQIFFQTKSAAVEIEAQLEQVNADWNILGEPSMFTGRYLLRTPRELEAVFGANLVASVQTLDSKKIWQGPFRSEFGWHWIRLDERLPAELPALNTVRQQVSGDYLYAARSAAREAFLLKLQEDYRVIRELH